MSSQTWTVAEAKAKFQRNYRAGHGRWPHNDYSQRTYGCHSGRSRRVAAQNKRVGNLAEFFAESPLRESGLKIRRSKDRPRKLSL